MSKEGKEFGIKLVESVSELFECMEEVDEDTKLELYDLWNTIHGTLGFLIEMYLREKDQSKRDEIIDNFNNEKFNIINTMDSLDAKDTDEFFKSFMYKGKKVEA